VKGHSLTAEPIYLKFLLKSFH